MRIKHLLAITIIAVFVAISAVVIGFFIVTANLPQIISLEDYKPLVVSEVYSREGTKVGEFFREKRIVIPYQQMPEQLVHAFVAAEDSQFFKHSGINFMAILRASWANMRAGSTVQGGSTITQQVAKSLLLSSVKTYTRKVREAVLATRMEKNLKKEDILYLYLNQIYLGHGAYGVEAAAQNYFRKHVNELTLAECALLAGLPQAPSKYSPLARHEINGRFAAKDRQVYVLNRMVDQKYITREEAKAAEAEPVKVYFREAFEDVAPFYKETVRQFLVMHPEIGEEKVLEEGVKIYTAMDLKKQVAAQESVEKNLRVLDKRQGYRGVKQNLTKPEDVAKFLVDQRDALMQKKNPFRIIAPDGKEPPKPPLDLIKKPGTPNIPAYVSLNQILDGIVTKVDTKWGLVTVRFGESQGLIDIEDMSWARKPDPAKHYTEDVVKDPSKVLTVGDVIEVMVKADKFSSTRIAENLKKLKKPKKPAPPPPADLPKFDEYVGLSLEQKPAAQGALISFDLDSSDVIAMVGGANYKESEYNRTIQAARQTGSSFKAIIYAAALEKGYTPATTIVDAPVVYEEEVEGQDAKKDKNKEPKTKKWKPGNFGNKFLGDVLFRNALIHSLNIPTVKILEKIGLDWVAKYARRLGIFSSLNLDLSMALGSSGTTVYEMAKAFAVLAKNGRRIHPVIIQKVTDSSGQQTLLEKVSLDEKFKKELDVLEVEFHPELAAKLGVTPTTTPTQSRAVASPVPGAFDPNTVFNFSDPDQVISPQTAYLITHLMKGVVLEGTGGRARALGKPVAGKTGTTNGYYDAWFVGYSPNVSTAVWVGFDNEKPLGKLETGNAAALPIWVDFMNVALADKPSGDFTVPPGIVFANIDAETGRLASAKSKKAVREAFKEGTEPTESSSDAQTDSEEKNFFKEDLSD